MNNNNSNSRQQLQPSPAVVVVAAATGATSPARPASPASPSNRTSPAPTASGRSTAGSSRAKFIKSKSSPSSLTTHKFGLRPTPSPPRLIIDHQTGDIVERYPEKPVFLRTYQPLDETASGANSNTEFASENDDDNVDIDDDDDDDTTQNQIDDSFASIGSQQQRQQQQQQFRKQQAAAARRRDEPGGLQMADFNQHTQTTSRPNQPQYQQHAHQALRPHPQAVIPPPHSGKVYFAPPVTSNNLFEPQLLQQQQQLANGRHARANEGAQAPQPQPVALGAPSAAVRRALNSLSDDERTDIAILTEPDDAYEAHAAPQMKITATSVGRASALLARQQPRPQVISTNASKLYGQPAHSRSPSIRSGVGGAGVGVGGGDKWLAVARQQQQLQQQQQQQRQRQQQQLRLKRQQTMAAIEDFDLYNFCFNLRILIVLLVSALILYLLLWPLGPDCAHFRPTYAHVALTTACVNLFAVLVFSLFWYCSSISRTLYQDLSSSAFIVTAYSILVCLNLTLGIVFFFVNTCHAQKLLATHSAQAQVAPARELQRADDQLPLLLTADDLIKQQQQQQPGDAAYARLRRQRQQQQLRLDEILETIERQLGESDRTRLAGGEHSRRVKRHRSLDESAAGSGAATSGGATSAVNANADDNDDGTVLDDQLGQQQQQPQQRRTQPTSSSSTTTTSTRAPSDFFNQDHASGYAEVPEVSPVEAAWAYLKEQARAFRRHFHRFLLNYDLKFIGALHAICAACFQYLAIKVAVVRSFYCAPDEIYA